MQAEYWRRRESTEHKVAYVQYGNDVEGTAFCDHGSEDPLGKSDWNMRVRCQCCRRISAGQPTYMHTLPHFLQKCYQGRPDLKFCPTAHSACPLKPLSCIGAAQAVQLNAGPADRGDSWRVHSHALHWHGLGHLCLACGGPLPVLHQPPAPGCCQDLVQCLCPVLLSCCVLVCCEESLHSVCPNSRLHLLA